MLQEYYLSKIRKKLKLREKRIASLDSTEEVYAYQEEIRRKLGVSFGALPEQSPLNSRIIDTLDTGKLLIDKIIFESRPGFHVPALFYRKHSLKIIVPGILFLCGHSDSGKAFNNYQEAAQSLALCGFAVLVIDTYGQGERREFSGKNSIGVAHEHNLRGQQLLLAGEFLGTWFLWDAIRALDYLETRPEVDNSKLGVTGTSGGGLLTVYLNAFDDRLCMAAPSCYVTSLLNNFENELSADAEQNPPCFLSQNLDISDFLIAAAPKPLLILAQNNDFFDPRGTRKVYKELKKIYSVLGAAKNVSFHMGTGDHSYAPDHRDAAAGFFCTQTNLKYAKPESSAIKPLPEEMLYCAPEGCVDNLPGNRTILNHLQELFPKTVPSIKELLNISKIKIPYYRVLRPEIIQKKPLFLANRFAVETEPGIRVILKLITKSPLYYLPKVEKVTISLSGLIKIPDDGVLYLLDVRGYGECAESCHGINSEFFYTRYGNMLDSPYLGGKVYDVLTVLRLLKSLGAKHFNLAAHGDYAAVASIAARLNSGENTAVSFNDPPISWEELLKKSYTTSSEWLFVPRSSQYMRSGDDA